MKKNNITELVCILDRSGSMSGLESDTIGGFNHKCARPEDVPEHTIFVFTTDGLENASHRYGSNRVKRMIERQKEKYGWEFLFLATNIDAVETAEYIGISRNRAANYRADEEGMAHMFGAMSKAVSAMRCCVPMAENWSEERSGTRGADKKKGGADHAAANYQAGYYKDKVRCHCQRGKFTSVSQV